ncbi:MAG: hypothetical protein Q4F84_05035 [Fibrobacter sp.]|nr:hypothetical protein [Fibrobacter sp.]
MNDVMKVSVESVLWQDYRASNTGMVVFYTSDPVSELPIREIPEDLPSNILPEPNYETGTYGFYGCAKSKIRNAFVKSKIRYLLFMTKYAGTNPDFKDKFLITGYFKIAKVANVKRVHIRYCSDYSCLDESVCNALRADEKRFVSVDDAFVITEDVLKSWNYKTRVTRQTRVLLDEEKTMEVVEFLKSKNDITSEYVAETERLKPHDSEEEEAEE